MSYSQYNQVPPRRLLSSIHTANTNNTSSDDDDNCDHHRLVCSSAPTPTCSQPLGTPLPYDEHACSVSLPTWASVVGYEEGDPVVTNSLKCGYPRFVYHPYVLQLMKATVKLHGIRDDNDDDNDQAAVVVEDCLVLPSKEAAERCCAFLINALYGASVVDNADIHVLSPAHKRQQHASVRVVTVSSNVFAVLFPAETAAGVEAKAYWQHTGEVVSSRRAEEALKELNMDVPHEIVTSPRTIHHASSCDPELEPLPQEALRKRIAEWTNLDSHESIFLTPSGMSAIYQALRSSRRYQFSQMKDAKHNKGGAAIVYGFPYLDTLKMCSRPELVPGGVEFFGRGNEQDLSNLEAMLEKGNRNYCALLSEVPSNPLLRCPDLYKLRELADQYNFMLILDDTIANYFNVDLIRTGLADAVCTSLTKLASGRGDAMAGSIVANPFTEKGRWMQQDLQQHHSHADLFDADAAAILQNSTDFKARNDVINANAEGLVDWLNEHEDVKTVYYPKAAPLYQKVQSGGFGGLFSMILHSHMCQRTFYDALNVAKGPSLGTDFTLACPYTLLAHYHELDFAMSYDVPPNLVRVAVGLEPLDEMKEKFAAALRRSKLHPKVCMDKLGQPQQRRSFSTVVARSSSSAAGRPGAHLQTLRGMSSLLRFVRYCAR